MGDFSDDRLTLHCERADTYSLVSVLMVMSTMGCFNIWFAAIFCGVPLYSFVVAMLE